MSNFINENGYPVFQTIEALETAMQDQRSP